MKKTLLALSLFLFNYTAFADVYIANVSETPYSNEFKVTYKTCIDVPNQGSKCNPSQTAIMSRNGAISLPSDTVDFIIERIDTPSASYRINCAGFNGQAFIIRDVDGTLICSIAQTFAKSS